MINNDQALLALTEKLEGVKRSINEVTYNVLAEIIIRVDERSPVGDGVLWKKPPRPGYHGGQFRGNWQLGVNQIPVGYFPGKIDPSGVSTVGENIGKIPERAAYGNKYYLVNNVPYAGRIEYGGHSRYKAPRGVVRLVEMEMPSIVKKVVEDVKSQGRRTK